MKLPFSSQPVLQQLRDPLAIPDVAFVSGHLVQMPRIHQQHRKPAFDRLLVHMQTGTAPRYLLRDRDKIYGSDFRERIGGMSIEEVLSAPASPWRFAKPCPMWPFRSDQRVIVHACRVRVPGWETLQTFLLTSG